VKYISGLLVFLFVCSGLSAGNSRTLEWFVNSDPLNVVPDFEGSVHAENNALPYFSETWMPDIQADTYTVRLLYPIFQKLGSQESILLKTYLKDQSDSIEVHLSLGMQYKKRVLDLSFCPFIKKGNDYYKLISFDWDIRPVVSKLRSATVVQSNYAKASTSVLSTGKWKKIYVKETGIYKLTYSDIKGMGINPDLVQIYGYGGALLSENFSLTGYQDDLPPVAVYKELGADSIFNSGDYILFYAKGPISWIYNTSSSIFQRVRNHYSDKAYYFVGERSAGTKTASISTFTGTPNKEITSFTDHILHETERVNIGESVLDSGTGRELYGEDFTTSASQSFDFHVTNPDTINSSKVQVEFIARNTGTSICNVYTNNSLLSTLYMSSIASSDSYTYASSANKVASFVPKKETVTVKLNFTPSGTMNSPRACLNYIILNVRRYLKMTGSVLPFRDPNSVGIGNIGHYTIRDASEKTLVFDVTDPQDIQVVNGLKNGNNYEFKAPASTLHEYVCVDLNGSFSKPFIEGSVPNQNIHGNPQVDMVIISPREYFTYANTLAEAHRTYDNLSVLVVTPEQVYNEFSSGTPDATAYRRMMKLFYDRATVNDLPQYLLLFGDGVYDNRLVSTMFANNSSKPNKILTYQSVESLDGSYSYVTDDYFGFLDDTEGSDLPSAKLDIGIGRFPVSSEEQARIAVNKTISYMEGAKKGVWKNRLLFLADDGDDFTHVKQADILATTVGDAHPEFMINKVYIDAYSKETTASGSTVPDANNRFSELLNSGLLMLNYTGHGSTSQWAAEKLLTTTEIKAMTNKCLPLWVTATCDFTRYDAPTTSGGEYVFFNPNGGGVALFTTSRIVYSVNNFAINQSFFNYIFSKKDGVRYSLGKIMNLSKCSETLKNDRNKLSFTLIGDPALKLGYPEYSARAIQMNDKDISIAIDTIHALSKVKISGKIYREDGTWAEDFNGVISPTILDASEELTKLVNYSGSNPIDTTILYERSKVLFSGKDSVVNGNFSFTFVVPKDISYSSETCRINLYAYDENGGNEAQGSFDKFVISGTDHTVSVNTTGPEVELYLNDYDFVSGDEVNETPTLLARISDENGLNTSGQGIGHDMMLNIENSPSMYYKLNNNYTGDIGSYSSGLVQYVLPKLSAGKHYLSFKVWDVQNNSGTDSIWFVVKPGKSPSASNLRYAQQGENAWFSFTHDRPGVDLTVHLTIFDLMGRSMWGTQWNMQTEGNTSDTREWNLTDIYGRRLPNGIYICKVLMTDSNGAQTTETKKIRVAAQ